MKITKGEGELGRIYERLRKRSYRKISNPKMRRDDESWWPFEHTDYVIGVRDALKEVDQYENA